MSNAETKAASYFGPVATTTTATGGLQGVARYATSTSSANVALPTVTYGDGRVVCTLQGKYMDFTNESTTNGMNFAFGVGAAPTLVYGQAATLGTGHVSAGAHLAPGQTKSVIVPPLATHIAWIAAAGTDSISFYCSEGNVGDK